MKKLKKHLCILCLWYTFKPIRPICIQDVESLCLPWDIVIPLISTSSFFCKETFCIKLNFNKSCINIFFSSVKSLGYFQVNSVLKSVPHEIKLFIEILKMWTFCQLVNQVWSEGCMLDENKINIVASFYYCSHFCAVSSEGLKECSWMNTNNYCFVVINSVYSHPHWCFLWLLTADIMN